MFGQQANTDATFSHIGKNFQYLLVIDTVNH